MAKKYTYIIGLKADTSKFEKSAGNLKGLLKTAGAAAAGLFAADKIKDAALEAYNYAKEIDNIRTSVAKLTGLSGGVLNSVTGEIKAIADVYKKDYEEVLLTGNALAKQFGKTNSEALALIRKGFVAGADASGELLEQIKEYSAQFKAAGYDASEMIAIMSQSEKMGIFSDKGSDTIKEATLRLREMTAATRAAIEGIGLSSREIEEGLADGSLKVSDAIKLISARLDELPSTSAKVGTAIADIFGAAGEDAGLDFIRTLKDVDTNLDNLTKNASEQAKANERLIAAQTELNATAAAIFGGMNAAAGNAKAAILEFINDSVKAGVDLVNWFIDLYNESVVFRTAVEYVGMTFDNLWLTVKTVFNHIWNVIKTTGNALADLFKLDFASLKETLKKGFEDTIQLGKDYANGVAENFLEAVENTVKREKIEYVSLDNARESGIEAGEVIAEAITGQLTKKPAELKELDISKLKYSGEADLPDISENLFDPNTALGNKNRLSAMLAEINSEFSKASEYAKLYGDELTLYTDKQNILADSIKTLIDEGYSAEGEAIQHLIEMQKELEESQGRNIERMKLMQSFSEDLRDSLMATAENGADSFAEMGANILNTVRSVISGYIAKGVAAAVSAAMASAPFPLNILAAPTAAAMASTAFNSLIPAFADGGLVYGPTVGLMGEYPGAKSNPEVIAPLDKLRGMIQSNSINVPSVVYIKAKRGELEGALQFNKTRENRGR
ncbi:phage tail tape measure protein [Thermophagus sp. OGC60D27]|uniref:phage tail tape measure protein n=1 Tax=Thermophagus sp. OGC60D27 TaxID=3458415 RepID=UPI0040380132